MGEGEERKSDKNGDFPVALSCAASCRAFGATLQTSCLPLSQTGFPSDSLSPLPLPLCRFFMHHVTKRALQHYIVVLGGGCPAWRRLIARCITRFAITFYCVAGVGFTLLSRVVFYSPRAILVSCFPFSTCCFDGCFQLSMCCFGTVLTHRAAFGAASPSHALFRSPRCFLGVFPAFRMAVLGDVSTLPITFCGLLHTSLRVVFRGCFCPRPIHFGGFFPLSA